MNIEPDKKYFKYDNDKISFFESKNFRNVYYSKKSIVLSQTRPQRLSLKAGFHRAIVGDSRR